jgi:hypothetical protein
MLKKLGRIAAILVGIIVVLFAAGFYFSYKSLPPSEATAKAVEAPKSVGYGETGIIRTGVAAGVTEDDYSAIMKAASTKDRAGIDALIGSKRAVMIDNGTKVKVVGSGFNKRQVRLLDGDNQGASVWVPVEYVEAE